MRKQVATFLTVIFLVTSIITANSAIKSGTSCKKLGLTSISSGKKYTCIKSGKNLIWNKGVTITKLQPVATPNPTPSRTPEVSQMPSPAVTNSQATATTNPTSQSSPTNTGPELSYPRELENCKQGADWSIGKTIDNKFAYLSCGPDGRLHPENSAPKIDQITGLPIVDKTSTGIASIKPLTTNASTKTPSIIATPRDQLSDVRLCQIPNGNPGANFSSGFSMPVHRVKLSSNPVIQVVPIDFPNLQSKRSPLEDHKEKLDVLSSYWSHITSNKYKVSYKIPSSYIRMPKNIEDYSLGGNLFTGSFDGNAYWRYVQEALNQSDISIDFSQAQVVAIVTPNETTTLQIGTLVAEARNESPFNTNEDNFYNVLILGNNDQGKNSMIWGFTHEFGHFLGLEDLRDVTNPGAQDSRYLGVFDLYSASGLVEILAWSRYLLGAIDDSQVRCVTNQNSTIHIIHPVEEDSANEKLVVIPTGTYRAIAIESRRQMGYDGNLGKQDQGVIVYTIDTTIKHGLSPINLIGSPRETDHKWRTDSTLLQGETLSINGWKITNLESGEFGDVVKVEKI